MRLRPPLPARLLWLVLAAQLAAPGLATADPDGGDSRKAPAVVNLPLGEEAPSPATPRPRLARGASGPDVARLQRILNKDAVARGSRTTAADGIFGPDTLATLRSFQRAHHLEPTGVADEATWPELEAVETPELATSSSSDSKSDASSATTDASMATSAPSESVGLAPALEKGITGTGADATKPKETWHRPTKLSTQDLDTLARIIEAEAGVCSIEGKVAVGAVILNRVRGGWADRTVFGVVSEAAQFTGYGSATYNGRPSKDSVRAAKRAAAGEDPSCGAYYYYNPYIAHPSWASTMKETARIGTDAANTHRFMKP